MNRKEIVAIIAASAAAISAVTAVCVLLWGEGLLSGKKDASSIIVYSEEESNDMSPDDTIIENLSPSGTLPEVYENNQYEEQQSNVNSKKIDNLKEDIYYPVGTELYTDGAYSPYNADSFSLDVELLAAKMRLSNGEVWNIGGYPAEKTHICASLIEYDTGRVIQSVEGIIGDTLYFSGIGAGSYYYVVTSDGFKTAYSPYAFSLYRDVSKSADVLPWSICLEKNDVTYGSEFTIQLVDNNGESIPYANTSIRAIYRNGQDPSKYTSNVVTSDLSGLLTMWKGVDGADYYYVVNFSVAEDVMLQVKNLNGEYVDITLPTSGYSIAVYS